MAESQKATQVKTEEEKLTCGIIMPISGTPGTDYSEEHWEEVKKILERAASGAKFTPRLVSESEPTAVIHERIVNNLYYDNIIVCDVSNRNPNVMFELGMRLAFDKPLVIVKDETTKYSFDVANIQHMTYPLSLSFGKIEDFIEKLSKKISDTYEKYKVNPEEHSFLRNFGALKPQKLNSRDIDSKELLVALNSRVEQLSSTFSDVRREIRILQNEIEMDRKYMNRNSQAARLNQEYQRIQNEKRNQSIRSGSSIDDIPF